MTARRGTTGEFSFAAEGLAATAASAALRRVTSLADAAPAGRMFAAIATLTEISRRSEAHLEAGHDALSRGEDDRAALSLARALVEMDKLAAEASPELPAAQDAPDYLRRRR